MSERSRPILIVDRSLLAASVYRLLLEPLGRPLVILQRYAEFLLFLQRRRLPALLILNTNAVGKHGSEMGALLRSVEKVPKLILAPSEGAMDIGWVKNISAHRLTELPFQPAALLADARSLLSEGA
jgi:DNA-binding response OmpR family regulator